MKRLVTQPEYERVDDLTGDTLLEGAGWTLIGRGDGVEYDFTSLSNLLIALESKAATVFDFSRENAIRHLADRKT